MLNKVENDTEYLMRIKHLCKMYHMEEHWPEINTEMQERYKKEAAGDHFSYYWPIKFILKALGLCYDRNGLLDDWKNESTALESALYGFESELAMRYYPVAVQGIGGSGVVIRMSDTLFPLIDKALKFPRPVHGKIKLISDMLGKEINFLSKLNHPGIVKIVHYGTLSDVRCYENLPFYIMEFIVGSGSLEFMQSESTNENEFNTVVCKTAEILEYLHEGVPNGFAHLDIKPDNILINSSGQPVVIDLGTCKYLLFDEGQTTVACTQKYAHPELVRQLAKDPSDENRSKGDLKRSNIKPSWDLWAFGFTLLNWMGIDSENGLVGNQMEKENSRRFLYNRLSSYSRKYYLLLTARLLTYSMRTWLAERVGFSDNFLKKIEITSSSDLREIVGRLDGAKSPLAEIPELSSWSSGSIQAAPGTHVPCTTSLGKVLENPLFQRLNSISQLGVVIRIYPGAKHSRREHSLGTYANTGKVLKALYEDKYSPLFRQLISINDCKAVLLSALLHDIGQFPLAHDLEEIDKKIFNHSELTIAMLKGEFDKKKKGSRKIHFQSLEEVFRAWGVEPERIVDILNANPKNSNATFIDKLLKALISGPIDADKLDYLLRDARHTDVPYPIGVDVGRLFQCMTTIIREKLAGTTGDIPAIGIHSKGKVAAEFLILSRYAMFSQVYWHHAVRAQKAMIFRAVEALLAGFVDEAKVEEFKSDFITMVTSLPTELYRCEPTAALFPQLSDENKIKFGNVSFSTDLAPTDVAVLSWFKERLRASEKPEELLIGNVISRKLYKRLWIVSHSMDPNRWKTVVELWDKLDRFKRYKASIAFEKKVLKRLNDSISVVTGYDATTVKGEITKSTSAEMPWLLIDIPAKRPGSEIGLYYVLEGQRRALRKDDRTIGRLKISSVWEQYAQNLQQKAGKIRIFCHPKFVDILESSIPLEEGFQDLEDTLVEVG